MAGPVAGTDIRAAMLPAPGLYGGMLLSYANPRRFFDGNGNATPALNALNVERVRGSPFLLYIPDVSVAGGSIGIAAMVPIGTECGRRFMVTPNRCIGGVGDPYIEAIWSRFFGTMRPSRFGGRLPIPEGLTIALGLGVVIPVGQYNATRAAVQGLTLGGNIWDVAPIAAFTYVTPPYLGDGTEFSAKLYWNNYFTNDATQYKTGSVLNVNFAVTERFGRFQFGLAGNYLTQLADDTLRGVVVPPDGRRTEVLSLGPVVNVDIPEIASAVRVKYLETVLMRNSTRSHGVVLTLSHKLR